jgi:hypothetical protein
MAALPDRAADQASGSVAVPGAGYQLAAVHGAEP